MLAASKLFAFEPFTLPDSYEIRQIKVRKDRNTYIFQKSAPSTSSNKIPTTYLVIFFYSTVSTSNTDTLFRPTDLRLLFFRLQTFDKSFFAWPFFVLCFSQYIFSSLHCINTFLRSSFSRGFRLRSFPFALLILSPHFVRLVLRSGVGNIASN